MKVKKEIDSTIFSKPYFKIEILKISLSQENEPYDSLTNKILKNYCENKR